MGMWMYSILYLGNRCRRVASFMIRPDGSQNWYGCWGEEKIYLIYLELNPLPWSLSTRHYSGRSVYSLQSFHEVGGLVTQPTRISLVFMASEDSLDLITAQFNSSHKSHSNFIKIIHLYV
jgi:hypothetical protein